MNSDWKRGVWAGLVAGIIWGWLAMAVNSVTGVFPLHGGLLFNLTTFGTGGGVFGAVAGFLFAALRARLPAKGPFGGAALVSVALWLVLFMVGAVLAGLKPLRYIFEFAPALQGLFLAAILGLFIGFLWERRGKKEN